MDVDELVSTLAPARRGHDRVLALGGARNTLDLLRLATVRSDDVVLVVPRPDPGVKRFALRFAVTLRQRRPQEADLIDANLAIVSIGEAEAENAIVRDARRRAIPVHVAGRPLLSDFTLIAMLERHPTSFARLPIDSAVGFARAVDPARSLL